MSARSPSSDAQSAAPPADTRISTRLRWAGMIGNVVEWYDFAIYGYFAAIIGRQFFPPGDPTAALLAGLGVFAVGFLMRPLGGAVFGWIGDRFGRQHTLMISILAMGVPTIVICVLPTYASIGLAAPVLLVICRAVQGLAVGGEYTGSVVVLVENAPPHGRGMAGAWAGFGAITGILLGSGVGALLATLLTPEEIDAWGWRVAFGLGALVLLIGLELRRHLHLAPARRAPVQPWRKVWAARRTMVRLGGLVTANSVAFYMMFVYSVVYFEQVAHLPTAQAMDINTANMVLLLAMVAAGGWLSDRVGRRPVLLVSLGALVLLAWPLFRLLHEVGPLGVLAVQAAFAVPVGLYLGAQPTTMVEMVPEDIRCTAVSTAYNLVLGVLGGVTPLFTAWLVRRTHDDMIPAVVLATAAAISWVAAWTLRETAFSPLAGATGSEDGRQGAATDAASGR